jgi:hypothetical protein
MLSTLGAHAISVTGSTHSSTVIIFRLPDVSVDFVVGVTLGTMCDESEPTSHVLAMSHWFKVLDI